MTINLSSKVISKIYGRKLPKNLGFATFNKVLKRLREKLIFNAIIKSRVSHWKSTEDLTHFEESLQKSNDISSSHWSIQMLMIGHYKTKNEFVSPMMDSMLNRENVTYNFRNLQEFQLERKRNMFL